MAMRAQGTSSASPRFLKVLWAPFAPTTKTKSLDQYVSTTGTTTTRPAIRGPYSREIHQKLNRALGGAKCSTQSASIVWNKQFFSLPPGASSNKGVGSSRPSSSRPSSSRSGSPHTLFPPAAVNTTTAGGVNHQGMKFLHARSAKATILGGPSFAPVITGNGSSGDTPAELRSGAAHQAIFRRGKQQQPSSGGGRSGSVILPLRKKQQQQDPIHAMHRYFAVMLSGYDIHSTTIAKRITSGSGTSGRHQPPTPVATPDSGKATGSMLLKQERPLLGEWTAASPYLKVDFKLTFEIRGDRFLHFGYKCNFYQQLVDAGCPLEIAQQVITPKTSDYVRLVSGEGLNLGSSGSAHCAATAAAATHVSAASLSDGHPLVAESATFSADRPQ